MGTVCSSVSIASISQGPRLFIKHDKIVVYVGYWPTESAVVVAHQGTNPHKMHVPPTYSENTGNTTYRVLHRLSVLTDLHFHFMALDPVLFPGVPSGIKVHSGFAVEHKKTANQILAEVKRLMREHTSTNVILVRLNYLNCLLSGCRTYRFRYYTHRSVTHLAVRSQNLTRCS